MFGGDENGRLQRTVEQLSTLGKGVAVSGVQSMLLPHIMRVFAASGHETLERYIIVDYALVQRETPDGLRDAIRNLGSNPRIREQWEAWVLQTITPANIVEWLRSPEAWLDAEDADEQREELRRCADVIEETDGGMEWLETQVIDLYAMAGLVDRPDRADTHKRAGADD